MPLVRLINTPADIVAEHIVQVPVTTQRVHEQIQTVRDSEPTSLRFMLWNIWGPGSTQWPGTYWSVERRRDFWLKYLDNTADFIGMQEVYTGVFSPVTDYLFPPYNYAGYAESTRFDGDRIYGNASICKYPMTSTAHLYTEPTTSSDSEPRGYVKSVITVGTQTVTVFVTHLSTDDVRINSELMQLLAAANAVTGPVLVMGDMNASGDSRYTAFTSAGYTMVGCDGEFNTNNTAGGGTWYIDRMFYKGFKGEVSRSMYSEVPKTLSDHLPIILELNL